MLATANQTDNARHHDGLLPILTNLQDRLLAVAGSPLAEQLRTLLEAARDAIGGEEWCLGVPTGEGFRIRASLSAIPELGLDAPLPSQGVQFVDFGQSNASDVRIGVQRANPLTRREAAVLQMVAQQATIRLMEDARLRMAIDIADVGFAYTDLRTGVTSVDDRSRELYGFAADPAGPTYSIEEAQGRIHPDDQEIATNALLTQIAQHKSDVLFEHRLVHRDGSVRWNLVRGKIRFGTDGQAEELVTAGIDITQRKWREEVVGRVAKTVLSKLQGDIFEALSRVLSEVLHPGVVVLVENDYATSTIRTRACRADGELVTLPDLCQELYTGERPRHAIRLGERKFRELLPHLPESRRNAAGFIAVPLTSSAGQALGMLAISASGNTELDRFTESLLEIVASRAGAELERERAEAESRALEAKVQHAQKLESLGVLAGGIAHDFNNLLTAILGNTGLALLAAPPDSTMHARLSQIHTASQRAAELTAQMLAYSGRGALQMGPIQPNQVVQEISSLLSTVISKKAHLCVDTAPEVGNVEGDASQLGQILMNLITNASDALGERPGSIHVRTRLRTSAPSNLVHSWTAEHRSHVMIEVEDSGCGMDDEVRNQVFDPFFTTKFTGRGLGMAAVIGIVRQHEGAIEIDSQPGVGTTVRVFLPILEHRSEAALFERPALAASV